MHIHTCHGQGPFGESSYPGQLLPTVEATPTDLPIPYSSTNASRSTAVEAMSVSRTPLTENRGLCDHESEVDNARGQIWGSQLL